MRKLKASKLLALFMVAAMLLTLMPPAAQAVDLPGALAETAAVAGPDGCIYLFGGINNSATMSKAIIKFNPSTGQAVKLSVQLPNDFFSAAAVLAPDGKIYVFGPDATTSKRAVRFDPATQQIDVIEDAVPLSGGYTRIRMSGALGDDGNIYLFGGSEVATGRYIAEILRFNPTTGQAYVVASLPSARCNTSAVAAPNGKIYVFGGKNNDPTSFPDIIEFDPVTLRVTKLSASLPAGRNGASAALGPDGKIYVFGGRVGLGTNYTDQIIQFDPNTCQVTTLTQTLPGGRVFAAAAPGQDGKVYVFGGLATAGYLSQIFPFEPPFTPAVPTGLTAQALNREVTLTWNHSQGAAYYDIERSQDLQTWAQVKTVSASTVQNGKAACTDRVPEWDTTYYYRIKARTTGTSEPADPVRVDIGELTSPMIKDIDGTQGTTAVLQIFQYGGAAYYVVERSDDSTNFVVLKTVDASTITPVDGIVTINDTTVSRGYTYYYRVKVIFDDGTATPYSAVKSVETSGLPVPTIKKCDGSQGTSVVLTFGRVEGAASYVVERRQANGDGTWTDWAQVLVVPQPTAPGDITVTDTTVQRTTLYEYRVRTKAGSDQSKPSTAVQVQTAYGKPDPVVNLQAVWTDEGIRVSWEQGNNTASVIYWVFRSDGSSIGRWTNIAKTTALEYLDRNVAVNTRYCYKVVTYYAGQKSYDSSEVWASGDNPVSAPLKFKAAEVKHNQVKLTWQAPSSSTPAKGYILEQVIDGSWTKVADVEGVEYTVTGLEPNTTYGFRVRASNHPLSKYANVQVKTPPAPPDTPQNASAVLDGLKVTVSWDQVAGATKYTVDQLKNGVKEKSWTTTAQSVTNDYLKYGNTYTFRICAVGSGGKSEPAEVTVTTPQEPVSAPANFKAVEVKHNKVTLEWSAVPNAAEYTVKRSTDGKTYTVVGTTGETAFSDETVTANTAYYYTVQADNSYPTKRLKVQVPVTPPDTVQNLKAQAVGNQVQLTWDAVDGAAGYVVERYGANGSREKRASVSANTMTDKSLKYGTAYTYKVYARKGTALSPVLSDPVEVQVTTGPYAPSVTASTSGGRVTLKMTCQSAGVTFKVLRSDLMGQDYRVLAESVQSEYTDSGLNPGSLVYYRVVAVDANGVESLPANKMVSVK